MTLPYLKRFQSPLRIGVYLLTACSSFSQNITDPASIHWGEVKADLKVGWELARTEFHVGEGIVVGVHLRMVREGGDPIEVMSSTQLDPFSIGVYYGQHREPVKMTKQGLDIADPKGYFATRGSSMTIVMRHRSEIPLSAWWNFSRPGVYTVSITHHQPTADRRNRWVVVKAPVLTLQVVR